MTYTVKSPLAVSLWESGTEIEVNVIVSFKVLPGCSATRETPAEEPTVEITRFMLTNSMGELACPEWLADRIQSDGSFNAWLLSEADETEAYQRDMTADMLADERRLEA